jgi:protein-disulfide isomerase
MSDHASVSRGGNPYLVPIAIIIAGIFVAGSIYYSGGIGKGSVGGGTVTQKDIRPVDKNDHIRGSKDAAITLVEYSDTECPYCKKFHESLRQVMAAYGENGKVAWVYRNFPLSQLHSNAPKQAEALECAAEQGGNEAFWKYTDLIYERTPSNNGLDMKTLPLMAAEIGLDKAEFEKCLNSGKMAAKVKKDGDEAVAAGGQGTPFTVVLVKGGDKSVIGGFVEFDGLKQGLDAILAKAETK